MLKLTTCVLTDPKCANHIFKAMMETESNMLRPQRWKCLIYSWKQVMSKKVSFQKLDIFCFTGEKLKKMLNEWNPSNTGPDCQKCCSISVASVCCTMALHMLCVSTWLHADRAALPGGGEGEVAVHFRTGDLVTNHPPSGAQTSHTGLWRPDGLVEHSQTLVHALALLTWNNTDTLTFSSLFQYGSETFV